MSPSFTFVVGPQLGPLAAALGGHAAPEPFENSDADDFTRAVLRAAYKVHLGKRAVAWLPSTPPELGVHQRRSLERVLQGERTVVLREHVDVPDWLRNFPQMRAFEIRSGACLVESALEAAFPVRLAPGAGLRENGLGLLEAALEALRPTNPGAGTGSWRVGGALLVGDRPNPNSAGRTFPGWPFISQLQEGCSRWLSEHLENAGVPETSLYWVNAFRSDGAAVPGLRGLVAQLKPRAIVALGNNAAEALEDADLEFSHVHHPAFWKRYHFKDTYVLGKRLRKLLS